MPAKTYVPTHFYSDIAIAEQSRASTDDFNADQTHKFVCQYIWTDDCTQSLEEEFLSAYRRYARYARVPFQRYLNVKDRRQVSIGSFRTAHLYGG